MKTILNLKQLCNYLNISDSGARKLIREYNLPFYFVGNRFRFDLNEIDVWLENSKNRKNN